MVRPDLGIKTAGFQFLPGGCAGAALSPFRIERNGAELVFMQQDVGRIEIVWPFGFQARIVDGKGVLFASDGITVGKEGEEVSGVGGSGASGGRMEYR